MLSPSGDFSENLKIYRGNAWLQVFLQKIIKTKQWAIKKTTQKMLPQSAVNPPFLSLLIPNQALPYSGSVQYVGSQYSYISTLCYFYSSASICSKPGVCLYIHVCKQTRVHTPPRCGYLKPAKEWIWPALADSSNTLFLFNTKIWAVLLLSHANVIISLIMWMLLTSMTFPNQCCFKRHNTAQED